MPGGESISASQAFTFSGAFPSRDAGILFTIYGQWCAAIRICRRGY